MTSTSWSWPVASRRHQGQPDRLARPAPPPLGAGPYHYYFAVTVVDVPAAGLSDTATAALFTSNLVERTLARALIVPIDEAMNP